MRRVSRKNELKHVPIEEKFSTYDLGVTAALIALGFQLVGIKRTTKTKALFLFDHSDKLVEAAQRYWRQSLDVDALTYFNSIKVLKNQLYSN